MSTITRVRGDNYPLNIIIKDEETRQPFDITGASLTFSVSTLREPATANYLFQSTGSITNAVGGAVSFPFTTADADNFGNFYYDIEMTIGTEIRTLDLGAIIFTQDITK